MNEISDPIWRIQNLYLVKDKDRRRVRPKLKPSQQRIVAAIKDRLYSGKAIRHYDLKCRQSMVTTFWMLLYLDDSIFRPNTRSVILAQKSETNSLIWDAARFAHSTMPDSLRPELIEDSAKTLAFPNGSKMFVSLKVQGGTVNNLHVSEYPLCDPNNIEQTIAACPPTANITLEGVAEGMNHAYDKWAMAGDGFTRLFHPWFVQTEYRVPPQAGLKRTQDEESLAGMASREYAITLDDSQIQYRRNMKRDLKRLAAQEMAEDPISCFLASGLGYFNGAKMGVLLREAMEENKKNPPARIGESRNDDGAQIFDLEVWEKPQHRHVYVIGADVAEGVSGDYSVMAVLCVNCRKTAARYRARVGVDSFYRTLHRHGIEYNKALIAPERNNHGHAILLGLKESGYPNIYQDKRDTRLSIPNKTLEKPKFGWLTNTESKPIMLDALRIALEGDSEEDEQTFQPMFTVLDEEFLSETLIIREESGKIEAIGGKHDDTVMAYAIAYQMYLKAAASSAPLDRKRIFLGDKLDSA